MLECVVFAASCHECGLRMLDGVECMLRMFELAHLVRVLPRHRGSSVSVCALSLCVCVCVRACVCVCMYHPDAKG